MGGIAEAEAAARVSGGPAAAGRPDADPRRLWLCLCLHRPRPAGADPRGYLLNIGADPRTTEPALLIPACLDAIYAYERGHLALGPRYNFLVDLETIDPEFLQALNPIGRLTAPSDPSFHPSQSALTPHLIAFMRGRPVTA